ncbi:hypothetical protein [Tenacibaculum salmonis]
MTGEISLSEAHDYEIIHVKNTRDAEKELKKPFFRHHSFRYYD